MASVKNEKVRHSHLVICDSIMEELANLFYNLEYLNSLKFFQNFDLQQFIRC